MNGLLKTTKKERLADKEKRKMEMKVTYEIENGKKVKVKTWDDGTVSKFDENCNEIYHKDNEGKEEWYESDANGKLIHWMRSDGREIWNEYDSNGNVIHYKENNGYEVWREYDANGRKIHCKDSYGYEKWY